MSFIVAMYVVDVSSGRMDSKGCCRGASPSLELAQPSMFEIGVHAGFDPACSSLLGVQGIFERWR